MARADWQTTRGVLEAAYRQIGEVYAGNLPERDWKLADAILDARTKPR